VYREYLTLSWSVGHICPAGHERFKMLRQIQAELFTWKSRRKFIWTYVWKWRAF